MLAALDAAQSVGGDIRGKQSAALIVVSGKVDRQARGRIEIFNLRVDDNPAPLVELRRLVALQRAYNHMNAGDLATEHNDNEGALREYSAAEKIAATTTGVPQSRYAEMIYWHAVALVNMKRVDEVAAALRAGVRHGARLARADAAPAARGPAAGRCEVDRADCGREEVGAHSTPVGVAGVRTVAHVHVGGEPGRLICERVLTRERKLSFARSKRAHKISSAVVAPVDTGGSVFTPATPDGKLIACRKRGTLTETASAAKTAASIPP